VLGFLVSHDFGVHLQTWRRRSCHDQNEAKIFALSSLLLCIVLQVYLFVNNAWYKIYVVVYAVLIKFVQNEGNRKRCFSGLKIKAYAKETKYFKA